MANMTFSFNQICSHTFSAQTPAPLKNLITPSSVSTVAAAVKKLFRTPPPLRRPRLGDQKFTHRFEEYELPLDASAGNSMIASRGIFSIAAPAPLAPNSTSTIRGESASCLKQLCLGGLQKSRNSVRPVNPKTLKAPVVSAAFVTVDFNSVIHGGSAAGLQVAEVISQGPTSWVNGVCKDSSLLAAHPKDPLASGVLPTGVSEFVTAGAVNGLVLPLAGIGIFAGISEICHTKKQLTALENQKRRLEERAAKLGHLTYQESEAKNLHAAAIIARDLGLMRQQQRNLESEEEK